MREPPGVDLDINVFAGITPACAGTTDRSFFRCHLGQDHPRVCGNHHSIRSIKIATLGSPPRVREPLPSISPMPESAGITPACAGTT